MPIEPGVQITDDDGNAKVVTLDDDRLDYGHHDKFADPERPLPTQHYVYGKEDETGSLVGEGAVVGGRKVTEDEARDKQHEWERQRRAGTPGYDGDGNPVDDVPEDKTSGEDTGKKPPESTGKKTNATATTTTTKKGDDK